MRSWRSVVQRKKIVVKSFQRIFRIGIVLLYAFQESAFKRKMLRVMHAEKFHEIKDIRIIEGPVLKSHEPFEVLHVMVQDKIIRRVIHERQQCPAFVNDNGAVAPGEDGREKTGDLYILLFGERMRDTDGIILYEKWLVVLLYFPV
jgi:hypothetical protein